MPENMLDVFNGDAFKIDSLTDAIMRLPYVPGRVGELGIFETEGVPTTHVDIEEINGTLRLLPTKRRGEPANRETRDRRTLRTLKTLHIPDEDVVTADDVQNRRAFGSASAFDTVTSLVNTKLGRMKQNHMVTLEWLQLNALKGIVLDSDGSTVLYNLYTEFGITPPTIDFFLNVTTTIIRKQCLAVKRMMEDALGAWTYNHVHAFCGKDFFDALIDHPDVRKAYDAAQASDEYRNDPRKAFVFGEIVWEEYRGKVGNLQFVADDECRFFPVGAPGIFKTYFAPADYIETANTIGLPMYAKQAPDPSGLNCFVLLHTQQNPLPICTTPGALIRGIYTGSSSSSSSSSSSE